MNLNFQGTHLEIEKMFGPIQSENIIEILQAKKVDSKVRDASVFNRYLGQVKNISMNPSIQISVKFLKNEESQKVLETNHQVLKVLLNYLELSERQ